MNSTAQSARRDSFVVNGYWIEPDVFSARDMSEMFFLFYDVFRSLSRNRSVPLDRSFPGASKLRYPEDMPVLDRLVTSTFRYNKDLVGECYDVISFSSTFLRFLSKKRIEDLTREILDLPPHSALYGWTNRVRIDVPGDERRTYGWHQEVFYSIPESVFLQTWCPVMRDTTRANGTIRICPGSHKEGVAEQWWHDIEGRATQIIVNESLVNKYEQVDLEMKVGDLLFFDRRLFHESGTNSTDDEVRFSLVGMWHDVGQRSFRGPVPSFNQRTSLDPREYWRQECGEQGWERDA